MISEQNKELLQKKIEQPKTKHFELLDGSLQTKLNHILSLIESINREDYLDKYCVYYGNELFIFDIKTENKDEKIEVVDSKASKTFRLDTTYTTKELAELYIQQRACFHAPHSFGYQAFDIQDEKDNPAYANAYNEDGSLKEEHSFKINNVYNALLDIFNTLYTQLEETYLESQDLIKEESSMEQNDDIYIFEDIISYKKIGEIEKEEDTKKSIKTISLNEETVFSEINFKNNVSLDDSDSITFDLYQDNETFSKFINETDYINRILNYIKKQYNVSEFYIIAKNKDQQDYLFYTVNQHSEIDFFSLLTANNLNEVQIDKLGRRNNYINTERFKKAISFKRTINNF